MRYCYHCNHATVGKPLFCNHCGRTYDVKLCPRLHVNPRNAEVCSLCGSRDLSTPQPKMTFKARLLVVGVTVLLGTDLVLLSVFLVIFFLQAVLSRSDIQTALIGIGILLGLLWWIWFQIPHWLRKRIHQLLIGSRKDRDER